MGFKCLFNFNTFAFAILYFEIIYWINIENSPPLNCYSTVLCLRSCFYPIFFWEVLIHYYLFSDISDQNDFQLIF